MRHGDRRKWNHRHTESRKTVEEKVNVTPELKPTLEREESEYKLLEAAKIREDRLRK